MPLLLTMDIVSIVISFVVFLNFKGGGGIVLGGKDVLPVAESYLLFSHYLLL